VSGVAVVTGASRGLGLITANHLHRQGWGVAAIARSAPNTAPWSTSDAEGVSGSGIFVNGDVASRDDMARCAESTRAHLGSARLLICNAAILGPIGRLHELSATEYKRAIEVNFLGVVNTIAAYWSQLAEVSDARVIVVTGGGMGGPRPLLRAPAYVPSKAAVASLVEVLAPEFAEIGASITAVAPGAVIPTDFLRSVSAIPPATAGAQLANEAKIQRTAPADAADGYLRLLDYLASAPGRQLNGVILSGRWNTASQLDDALRDGLSPNMYRLRRIDGDLFDER